VFAFSVNALRDPVWELRGLPSPLGWFDGRDGKAGPKVLIKIQRSFYATLFCVPGETSC
jgi:hypothetical protein